MLIPIGHEEETVRRLPWVTIVIILLNLVLFVTVGLQGTRAEKRFAERTSKVFEYWSHHPYLSVPPALTSEHLSPRQREQLKLIREAFKHAAPQDPAELQSQQDTLNGLAQEAIARQEEHPLLRWGLIPRHPRPLAFLTAMFMHAGWLHLLSNMFILFLTGPAVEDAYGRPLFAALYLGGGIVASLCFVAMFPASQVPLVGASGAIAVVMGAFMVRFAHSHIRFFYWFFFIFHGTFSAPAWFMLGLWLAQQLFFASLSSGAGSGIAYVAHAGGFLFGVVAAVAIKRSRLEERVIHPAIEKQISVTQHPGLEEGMELLARGELAAAREVLGRALTDEPGSPDVHLALWQTFVAEGNPDAGAPHLVQVIEHDVRDGAFDLAFDRWRELVQDAGVAGPGVLRWRLAAGIAPANPDAEVELLQTLAAEPGAEILREKAERRLDALGIAVEAPARPAQTRPETAPTVPPPFEAPRAPEPPPSLVPPPEPPGLEVEHASVEAQQTDALLLKGGSVGVELAPYAKIEAVSVVGIKGVEKPYLLIDLIVPAEDGPGRRALRLTSQTFDPRKVTGRPDLEPMAALRLMLAEILRASRARILAGDEGLSGGRFPIFESVEAYEQHVLGAYPN